MNVNELKELVCKVIDDNYDKLLNLAKDIEGIPELGFKELQTSKKYVSFLMN